MKYTSAEAAKLLRKLNNDYKALLEKEEASATFVAAVSENLEACRPAYDYEKTQADLTALAKKIRKLKHAINMFNTTTKVPGFDMTIDELLVYIPQLTQTVQRLAAMKQRMPRQRVDHYQSNIIDYTYVNYNLEDAAADYTRAADTLARAQLALDKVNTTVAFEVDM